MKTRGSKVRVAAAAPANRFDDASSLFRGSVGRWATSQLKAAIMQGKALSSAALRTLDTLRHEEWKHFDDVLVEEATIRLIGVKDLMGAGLVRPVPNALGKMVFGYETVSQFDEATVSLDGLSQTDNDVSEFALNQLPLPITHKDFSINLRKLAASRETGEPLDTIQVAQAGRVCAEMAEKMLFQGGKTFGGLPIYGYTNFPRRISSVHFDGGKNWGDATKSGTSFKADVLAAQNAAAAQRQYGPFMIYVPTDAGVRMGDDYNPGTSDTRTIMSRIMQIPGISGVKVADQLPTGNVVIAQLTQDNVVWVEGDTLQTVQWDEGGGFKLNFKAWQIGVPLIRSTQAGRCGIVHLT